MFDVTGIPAELRERPQWVLWANVSGKKVPRQPRKPGRNASVSNPDTWAAFDVATNAAAQSGHGIGFVFTNRDPLVFVDLDWTHQLSELQRGIIDTLSSYTEVSPSGYGAHIFVTADKAQVRHATKVDALGVEIYVSGRFSTVTGNVTPYGSRPVANRTAELLEVIAKVRIPQGQRNNSMMRLAGKMRHGGMGKQEIAPALHRVNLERCDPPLPDTELDGIADRVSAYDVSGFLPFPRAVLHSAAFAALSPRAKSATLDIASRFNGENNGRITAPFVAMQERGWRSSASWYAAVSEAANAGFVEVVERGRSHVCTTYRLPWLRNTKRTPT